GVGAELDSARAEGARPGEPHLRTADLDTLRSDLERGLQGEAPEASTPATPPRWNAAPEDVERSVARLVLALVEFLRKLMERQAIRRMDEGTLTEAEVERLGRALMRLEDTVHDLARRFGLSPDELNLDLGPLGRLT
ncbi:MAG TPA: gas vesicle protein K, partial [Thermoanaerobaculia bacterium]|nr:gas vesicle protein K [Thermoanaerobaculia bacterium]